MILGIILSWYACMPGTVVAGQPCAEQRVARFVKNKKHACAIVRKEGLELFNAAYVFTDEAITAAVIKTRDIELVCGG